MTQSLPQGIITVLNTPFTADDSLDAESLMRNVRRASEAGVAGFLVPALAAEVYTLSPAERSEMVQCVLEARAPGLPVIGSATARTAPERLRHAGKLGSLGCDAVLVAIDPPGDSREEEALLAELRSLAAASGTPLLVQDWAPTGNGLSLPFIGRMAGELPEVTGLKVEIVPSGPRFTAVRREFGERFHLSGGWTVLQLIEGLDRGVDAFMPTGMHELYVQIDRLHRSGDRDGAVALFRRLLPILAFSNQHLDTSVHFFKRLLHAEGTYQTALCRTSSEHFDEVHEATAAELIGYARKLTREVTGAP